MLTADRMAGTMLLVFGFREEAELFLKFGMTNRHWRIEERSPGELISLLYGPNANVKGVALDPLPAVIAGSHRIASLSRDRFVASILDRARRLSAGPHDSNGAVVDGANRIQKVTEETAEGKTT